MAGGTSTANSFALLDGLRGIGAVLVVVGHGAFFWGGLPMQTQLMPYLVDMFFVFSGFVIAYAYEPKLARGLSASGFMLQRLIRLYPIYLIGLLLGLCIHVLTWIDEKTEPALIASEVLPQLVMLPSLHFDAESLFTLNPPAWSLFFELWVNMIYVLIFRMLTTRVLIGVVLLFAVLVVVASYTYGAYDGGSQWRHIWGGFPRAGFGFFLGVLIFRMNGSPRIPPRGYSTWAWIPMMSPILLAVFAVPEEWAVPARLAALFIYGPVMIWLATRVPPPPFVGKACVLAGSLSYALYMLHYPLLSLAQWLAWRYPNFTRDLDAWMGVGLLVVSVALAVVVVRYCDGAIRRWLGRVLKRQATRGLSDAHLRHVGLTVTARPSRRRSKAPRR